MGGFISGATDKLGLHASSSPHACGDESTCYVPRAACALTADNYGSAEWWLLLNPVTVAM